MTVTQPTVENAEVVLWIIGGPSQYFTFGELHSSYVSSYGQGDNSNSDEDRQDNLRDGIAYAMQHGWIRLASNAQYFLTKLGKSELFRLKHTLPGGAVQAIAEYYPPEFKDDHGRGIDHPDWNSPTPMQEIDPDPFQRDDQPRSEGDDSPQRRGDDEEGGGGGGGPQDREPF